ncbi:MAG: hypothetical protein MJZ57_07510 [Bacteroidales bacterium]|nr:hypothetical protein [Bacteroidales bacterium]
MKRNLFILVSLILSAITFSACDPNHSEEIDYANLVVNDWRLSTINDVYVASDKFIIYNIKSDGTMLRALCSSDGRWMENTNFRYTINTHYLTLEGTDVQGDEWVIELDISRINTKAMTFGVKSIKKNGIQQVADNNIYSFVKNEDKGYAPKLVGIWQGKEISANASATPIFFVEMNGNGMYSYYKMNAQTESWEIAFQAQYYVYGEILAHNYLNDNSQQECHCWTIYVDDNNTIRLKAVGTDGNLKEYKFNRVDGIPQ